MRLKIMRFKLKIKLSSLLGNVYDYGDHGDTNPFKLDTSTKTKKMKGKLQKKREEKRREENRREQKRREEKRREEKIREKKRRE